MEKITNYRLQDFLLLEDYQLVSDYMDILDLLMPVKSIADPINIGFPSIKIKPVMSLTFGQVLEIRNYLNSRDIEAVCLVVGLVTGLINDEVFLLPILDFYGIISSVKCDIIQMANMEANELENEDNDPIMFEVNAGERLARFGALNPINSLAGDDITKWDAIQKLPYTTVFTKLKMDKERAAINKDIQAIQKRKQQQ